MKRSQRAFRVSIAILAMVGVWIFLKKKLVGVSFTSFSESIALIPTPSIQLSIWAVVASYVAISFYDRLSLHIVGKDLTWRRSAGSSISSYTVSRVFGASLITGNFVRFWWFAKWGLGLKEVVNVTLITLIITNTVMLILVGLFTIWIPDKAALFSGIGLRIDGVWVYLGLIGLVLSAVFVFLKLRPRLVTVREGISRGQYGAVSLFTLLAILDYLASCLVLYALLYHLGLTTFPAFFVIFTVGSVLGMVSNIPAGLGVIEAALLLSLPAGHETEVISSCVVYRLFYDVIPFALSSIPIGYMRFKASKISTIP